LKTRGAVVAAALIALAGASANAAPRQALGCTDVEIGVLAPLTGQGRFLGREQLSWASFAVSTYNKRSNTFFAVRQADSQLAAAQARTVARGLVADARVLGVVGGSTNQSVLATGALFAKASLASVTSSAMRADLTDGRFSTFFRVVPSDGAQARSIAGFVKTKLKGKRVLVLATNGDRRSSALATGLLALLPGATTKSGAGDSEALAELVPGDTDLVVFATTDARAANDLARELVRQKKRARVFGTDTYSPDLFKPDSGYTSSFVTDLRYERSAQKFLEDYVNYSRGRGFGPFGPPSYMAAWVLMRAIERACEDGKASRAEVVARLRKTNVPSILGGRIRFTARGEPTGARFVVYRVTDGAYRKVW
jgi:ABC-type branched-subunit amino acid transport system substrate-binding protein